MEYAQEVVAKKSVSMVQDEQVIGKKPEQSRLQREKNLENYMQSRLKGKVHSSTFYFFYFNF